MQGPITIPGSRPLRPFGPVKRLRGAARLKRLDLPASKNLSPEGDRHRPGSEAGPSDVPDAEADTTVLRSLALDAAPRKARTPRRIC